MGLKLSDDGDIVYDETTRVVKEVFGDALAAQNALCELRCEQGLYFADENYGRSTLVWKLPTSRIDKLVDVKRVVEKSLPVKTIAWDGNDDASRIVIEV